MPSSAPIFQILAAADEGLGRPGTMPEDSVIHLGMGSLDATRLSALIRSRTGVDMILDHPTPRGLASLIDQPDTMRS